MRYSIWVLVVLLVAGCARQPEPTAVVVHPTVEVDSRPPMLVETPDPDVKLGSPLDSKKVDPPREVKRPPKVRPGPVIQVAVILDTSKSMDGLVHQAQTRLWNVVNEMAKAKHKDGEPTLEVALYEYGANRRLPASSGYVRQVVPFTTDLDAVSEELFKLTCDGGLENAPWAIETACKELDWSQDPDDLKSLFIAGNENFVQGPVKLDEALRAAHSRGIVVNPIFCGQPRKAEILGWTDVAEQSGGSFLAIDQDEDVKQVAPQDKELVALNDQLNSTYIPYGDQGVKRKKRQVSQDKQARSNQFMAGRVAAKAQRFYRNSEWDLVDAAEEGTVKLESLAPAAYPKAMRKMSSEKRANYLRTQSDKRKRIKKKIQRLSKERESYLAKKKPSTSSLDTAMTETLRRQGAAKGYKF